MNRQLLSFFVLLGACSAESDLPVDDVSSDLHSRKPQLIQSGADQILIAVTSDHAIYQEGQTVYATELRRGAPRHVVGDVPGTNLAFPLQVGDVVFVWTNPQRNLPGFGVSPLVLWTPDRGARLISAQSAVGLVATAASDDGKQILFTTSVTDDGARGDIVWARTRDALSPTPLLTDIRLGFPTGTCRPLAGFAGPSGRQFPTTVHCPGTDLTATLSTWERGTRRDLISNIAIPLPFTLETNLRGDTFLVGLASAQVARVTTDGEVTIVDNVGSRRGFLGRHDTAVYVGPGDLRLARRGQAAEIKSPLALLYQDTWNRNGYTQSRLGAPDRTLALFGSVVDPATGLTDMNLLDLKTGKVIALDPTPSTTVFSEIWTADSELALYFDQIDFNVGTGRLVAGGRGGARPVSPTNAVWDVLRQTGSEVSYVANPVFHPTNFFLSTGDLYLVDAGDPDAQPRLVSTQVNLNYLATTDRRFVVFPSNGEPGGPGLYVASARP